VGRERDHVRKGQKKQTSYFQSGLQEHFPMEVTSEEGEGLNRGINP